MFNRLCPMSIEIMFGGFQMMLCGAHGFQCFINVRMTLRRG